jgi:hypothetical protein
MEGFRWHITVKETMMGIDEMLGVHWLQHQPFQAVDDVSSPVFDRASVFVIPSHILKTV